MLTVSAALCLTACGGGDADTPLPSIEGLWTLTDAEGVPGKLLVLEDGTGWLWTVASHSAAGSTYVDVPVVYLGDARTTSPNTFSLHVRASGPDPRLEQHSKDLLTGSFTPRGSLETAATSRMALTGRYTASYDQAADGAAVAGTYQGVAVSSPPTTLGSWQSYLYATLTLSTAGAATLDIGSCTGTGTVTPRRGGKGVFDVSLQFSTEPCNVPPGERVTGVGLVDAQGKFNLVALTAAGNNGVTFIGAPLVAK